MRTSFSCFLLCILVVFLATGCQNPNPNNGAEGEGESLEGEGETEGEAGMNFVTVELGPEGGLVNLGEASLESPPGALPSAVTVELHENASGAEVELAENETPLSPVLSLRNDQEAALPSAAAPFRLSLPFDTEALGKALPTQAQVFVKMDTGEEIYTLTGTLSENLIEILLYGLHYDADFQVVYNSNCVFVVEDGVETEKLLTPTRWDTTNWKLHIDIKSTEVREGVAAALGMPDVSAVTDENVVEVVKDRILRNAREVSVLYNAMPLRQPNVEIRTKADGSKRMLLVIAGQRNYYENPTIEDGVGQIHIAPKVIGWNAASPLGTARNAIAHEMFHACVNGYELKQGKKAYRGYNEGMATVMGHTVDNGNIIAVRRNQDDRNYTMLLNRPLGLHDPRKESYTNQDFFAYVGKRYGGGSLTYIAGTAVDEDVYSNGVLEQARKYLTEADTLHPWNAPLGDYLTAYRYSLHNALLLMFDTSLAKAYWDFAKNRAYENSAESRLRAEEPATQWELRTERFEAASSILDYEFPGDNHSESLSYQNIPALANLLPMSTHALVFTGSGFDATLTLSFDTSNWAPDDLGNGVKVKIYKSGEDGSELAAGESSVALKGFGTSFTKVVVLISNVSVDEGPYSLSLTAATAPNEEPGPCTPDTPWDRWLVEYSDCDGVYDRDNLWHFKSDGTIADHWTGVINGYSWSVVDNRMIIVLDEDFGMEASFSEDCTEMVDGVYIGEVANPSCWRARQY